jgi:hypothetical protein
MANENETRSFSPLLTEEELPRSRHEHMQYSHVFLKYIRTFVAELLATATFVFVGVCSAEYTTKYTEYREIRRTAAFTHGFILFVNVAATANIR